jgi:type I restriction enzyme, S subunit
MSESSQLQTSPNSYRSIWNNHKIDDVFTFINGKAFYVDGYSSEGIRVLDLLNINRDGLFQLTEKDKFISEDVYRKYPKSHLEKNDLIMIMTDITPQLGLIGKCTIINESYKYALNQRVGCLRLKSDYFSKVSLTFINYLINSRVVREQVINNTLGTAQFYINTPDIKKIGFPLPPLPEQQKIASILTSVDTVIEKTEAQITKLKDLKKAMMQELLTKGIGHTEFKDSPVGRIPKSWRVRTIGEITSKVGSGITPRGGSQIYQDAGVNFVRSQNIHFSGMQLDDVVYISQEIHDSMASTKLQEGDVLLNITGASIGRCTYVPKGFGEGNVNQHVCIIRVLSDVENIFLSYWLGSEFGQEQIFRFQAGGNREGLNFQQIKGMKLPVPNLPEQQKIACILTSVDANLEDNYNKLNHTKSLKKALMQDLLTGKVRVAV